MLKLQVETAKNIGGIEARSFLYAPEEIGKYYFGPVQIALSLLWAAIEKYDVLSKGNRLLQDMAIEEYCQSNREFIVSLKALRDSIIHPRSDNVQAVKEFSRAHGARHVALLIEGELAYRNYLIRSQDMLRTTKLRSMRVRRPAKSSQTVHERPHGYFRTMCTNLAMASSFSRDSFMSNANVELGFLEVEARSHAYIHNQSTLHIVAALLYQAIENYLAIQNLKPNFIDRQLETFLDSQDDRDAYIDGMRLVRNSTFMCLISNLGFSNKKISRFSPILLISIKQMRFVRCFTVSLKKCSLVKLIFGKTCGRVLGKPNLISRGCLMLPLEVKWTSTRYSIA